MIMMVFKGTELRLFVGRFCAGGNRGVVYSAFCLIMVVISSLMDNYILGGIAFAETDAVKICKTYSPMISIHSLITEADLMRPAVEEYARKFQSTASSQRLTWRNFSEPYWI